MTEHNIISVSGGSTHIIRYALEMGLLWIKGDGRDKVREALDALDTLEAQLEAIGAGGVSPLIGQPQAMPDLSQLTERGAVAWAGVDAQALREGRWYMVTNDGVATLCEDLRDAEKEAKAADMAWPYSGPHRAVQLVEASTAGYTAADMATAESRGFRDGVASLAASAGEPVATVFTMEALAPGGGVKYHAMIHKALPAGTKLYTHPSPPEGMAGWTKASEQLPPCRDDQFYIGINTAGFAGVFNAVRVVNGNTYCLMEVAEESVSIMSDLDIWKPFNPPTSAEGVEHV